ncbi:hypothetical protein C5167_021711 [Papaver somniferum]|uniref:Uncharacterized protein n=1 Tax=Papaver somniferum TaxID=3469 RepID=A0A4Y7JHE1_PAPSO|nr:uncharacterized protein LOC113277200 [Papaver somniferum]RZC59946.1 hypothetical protein C5167_021711 [Papaver somniferum]
MSADQSPNTDGWVQSAKNTANAAGGHIGNAAQATRDFVTGAGQPKKEETPGFLESAKNTASTAGGHVAGAAQTTKDYVVGAPKKEETPGFLQQTGTNVMNTAQAAADTVTKSAQGAVDAVKNTMGMNDEKK